MKLAFLECLRKVLNLKSQSLIGPYYQPITDMHQIKNQTQSPVRDRHSKKRNYSGKTTCVPATEYSGSPAPPSKSNSSRAKEGFPKFDVANENDFDDLENSNSLFDEVGFQIQGSHWFFELTI